MMTSTSCSTSYAIITQESRCFVCKQSTSFYELTELVVCDDHIFATHPIVTDNLEQWCADNFGTVYDRTDCACIIGAVHGSSSVSYVLYAETVTTEPLFDEHVFHVCKDVAVIEWSHGSPGVPSPKNSFKPSLHDFMELGLGKHSYWCDTVDLSRPFPEALENYHSLYETFSSPFIWNGLAAQPFIEANLNWCPPLLNGTVHTLPLSELRCRLLYISRRLRQGFNPCFISTGLLGNGTNVCNTFECELMVIHTKHQQSKVAFTITSVVWRVGTLPALYQSLPTEYNKSVSFLPRALSSVDEEQLQDDFTNKRMDKQDVSNSKFNTSTTSEFDTFSQDPRDAFADDLSLPVIDYDTTAVLIETPSLDILRSSIFNTHRMDPDDRKMTRLLARFCRHQMGLYNLCNAGHYCQSQPAAAGNEDIIAYHQLQGQQLLPVSEKQPNKNRCCKPRTYSHLALVYLGKDLMADQSWEKLSVSFQQSNIQSASINSFDMMDETNPRKDEANGARQRVHDICKRLLANVAGSVDGVTAHSCKLTDVLFHLSADDGAGMLIRDLAVHIYRSEFSHCIATKIDPSDTCYGNLNGNDMRGNNKTTTIRSGPPKPGIGHGLWESWPLFYNIQHVSQQRGITFMHSELGLDGSSHASAVLMSYYLYVFGVSDETADYAKSISSLDLQAGGAVSTDVMQSVAHQQQKERVRLLGRLSRSHSSKPQNENLLCSLEEINENLDTASNTDSGITADLKLKLDLHGVRWTRLGDALLICEKHLGPAVNKFVATAAHKQLSSATEIYSPSLATRVGLHKHWAVRVSEDQAGSKSTAMPFRKHAPSGRNINDGTGFPRHSRRQHDHTEKTDRAGSISRSSGRQHDPLTEALKASRTLQKLAQVGRLVPSGYVALSTMAERSIVWINGPIPHPRFKQRTIFADSYMQRQGSYVINLEFSLPYVITVRALRMYGAVVQTRCSVDTSIAAGLSAGKQITRKNLRISLTNCPTSMFFSFNDAPPSSIIASVVIISFEGRQFFQLQLDRIEILGQTDQTNFDTDFCGDNECDLPTSTIMSPADSRCGSSLSAHPNPTQGQSVGSFRTVSDLDRIVAASKKSFSLEDHFALNSDCNDGDDFDPVDLDVIRGSIPVHIKHKEENTKQQPRRPESISTVVPTCSSSTALDVFSSAGSDPSAETAKENSKINLLDRVSRTDSNDDSLAAIDGSTEDEDEELHFNSAVYDSNHKVSHRRPLPKDMPSQDQVRENPTLLKAMLLQLSSSSTDDDFLRMNAVSQADGDGLICWPDIRLIEADMATPHPQALLMPSYRNSTPLFSSPDGSSCVFLFDLQRLHHKPLLKSVVVTNSRFGYKPVTNKAKVSCSIYVGHRLNQLSQLSLNSSVLDETPFASSLFQFSKPSEVFRFLKITFSAPEANGTLLRLGYLSFVTTAPADTTPGTGSFLTPAP